MSLSYTPVSSQPPLHCSMIAPIPFLIITIIGDDALNKKPGDNDPTITNYIRKNLRVVGPGPSSSKYIKAFEALDRVLGRMLSDSSIHWVGELQKPKSHSDDVTNLDVSCKIALGNPNQLDCLKAVFGFEGLYSQTNRIESERSTKVQCQR